MCLDILRAVPTALPALLKEINQARGYDSVLDRHLTELNEFIKKNFRGSPDTGGFPSDIQRLARELAERLAVSLQASIMIRFGNPKVSFISQIFVFDIFILLNIFCDCCVFRQLKFLLHPESKIEAVGSPLVHL